MNREALTLDFTYRWLLPHDPSAVLRVRRYSRDCLRLERSARRSRQALALYRLFLKTMLRQGVPSVNLPILHDGAWLALLRRLVGVFALVK